MTPNEARTLAIQQTQKTGRAHCVIRCPNGSDFELVEESKLGNRFSFYNTNEHLPSKIATIIIPARNDFERLQKTIQEIHRFTDMTKATIVVVNDNSSKEDPLSGPNPFKQHHDLYLVNNTDDGSGWNVGVGNAFDRGVRYAKTDVVILIGADTRPLDKGWLERMVETAKENPKSLVASVCVGINDSKMFVDEESTRRYAAETLWKVDKDNNGGKDPLAFRAMLEAKWLTKKDGDTYKVPCILGACYSVTKSWYNHIGGFAGHVNWGTLEPLISIRSYACGGDCLVETRVETSHHFSGVGGQKYVKDLIYNKLMLAYTSLPLQYYQEVDKWAATLGKDGLMARAMILNNQARLDEIKERLETKKAKGTAHAARLAKAGIPKL